MGSLDLEMYFEHLVLANELNAWRLHDLEEFKLYTCADDLAIQRDLAHNAVLYMDERLLMPEQEDLTLLPLYEQAYLETLEKHCQVLAHYKTTADDGTPFYQVSIALAVPETESIANIVDEAAALRHFIRTEMLYTFRRAKIRHNNSTKKLC